MEETLFKNTRKHDDTFKTGTISREFKLKRDDADAYTVRHKTLEAVDVKMRDDMVLTTMKRERKLELAHGVDYQLERPKHKNHIAFSRLYTEIEAGDSEHMQLVRTTMGRYYDYKELAKKESLTPDQKQWVLESQMNALFCLMAACDKYAANRKVRLFKRAKTRRAEVRKLKERAEKELESAKIRYADFMEKKVKENGYASAEVSRGVIKLRSLKGAKGKRKALDLSQLDLNVQSDREAYSEKHHMAIRSELDLKKENLTPEEKALLTKINEYSKITTNAGMMEYYRKNNSSKEKKERKVYKKEIKLLDEITKALLEMKTKGDLTDEKKNIFSLYMDNLLKLKTGGLDIEKAKMTNYNTLDYSAQEVAFVRHKQYDDGKVKQKSVHIKDRSNEPLFPHEPCMSDVVQDALGDCFVLAAISELVAKDSQAIMNMMHDDGKTVTVRLYTQKGYGSTKYMEPTYVKVDKRINEDTATDSLWVQILCKAYAAFVRTNHVASNEDFEKSYGEIDKANWSRDDRKYIEYGFIDGGQGNEVMPVLTGELYKEKDDILGSADEVDSDIDVIKIMHESKYTDAQQEKFISSGRIFDLDIAYVEEKMDITGREMKEPKKMVYVKSVFSKTEKILEERLDSLNKEYKSLKAKHDVLNSPQEIAITRTIEYKVKEFADRRASAMGARQLSVRLMDFYAGEKSLTKVEEDFLKEVVDDINKDPNAVFNGDSESSRTLKEMPPQQLAEYITEVMTIKGKLRSYDNISSNMFYGYENREAPLEPTEEEKKAESIGMKKACLRLASDAIKDIENTLLAKREDVIGLEEDKVAKYKLMYKLTDELKVESVTGVGVRTNDPLVKLAKFLNLPIGEALEFVKDIMKEKYRIFDEKYEEVSNGKTAQIFSGAYSSSTVRLYNRIKTDIKAGKKLNAGTREGWGKKTARGETKDKGTVGKHAYAVLGVQDVEFRGKKIHMVKLRNPWGSYTTQYFWNEKKQEMEFDTNETESSGVFFMELTHFSRVFRSVFSTDEERIR